MTMLDNGRLQLHYKQKSCTIRSVTEELLIIGYHSLVAHWHTAWHRLWKSKFGNKYKTTRKSVMNYS